MGPSAFRFELMWLKYEGFKETLKGWWQNPVPWFLQLHSLCKAESSKRYSEDLEQRSFRFSGN